MLYNPVELILKKRDGYELSQAETAFFIHNFMSGKIADYQMSALLMSYYFRGATPAEISALTAAYIESGKRLSFPDDWLVADKHSTGGVGDKISLMLAPIAAALGLKVPMISGRGLGHTGGTLDKLESLPGFNTQYSTDEIVELVKRYGFAMVGQSENIVPADKRIYALRDVTATVESPALITASIMSKKIAEGAKYLVIDLKIGSGAFMPTLEKARELALHLKRTGESFGQKVTIVFTNMNSPLGYAVGNGLEMREAIQYLKGDYLPDTYELTTCLVSQMLLMAGLAKDDAEAKQMIDRVVEDGSALHKFAEIVHAQGGNTRMIEHDFKIPLAPAVRPIVSPLTGYVQSIDSRAIGYSLVKLKAGRMKADDTLDYGTGAKLYKKIGDRVVKSEVIGHVYANDSKSADDMAKTLLGAYTIENVFKEKEPLIYDILT